MGVSGTPQKVTLDGMTFHVAADTDLDQKMTGITTEGIATSGPTMYKMVRRVATTEGLPIMAAAEDKVFLIELAGRTTPFPIAITMADGSVETTQGLISYEDHKTAENRANVTLIPADSLKPWDIFTV